MSSNLPSIIGENERLPPIDAGVQDCFSAIEKICDEDLIRDCRCKLCCLNDDVKDQAHEVWENTKKFVRVVDFLNGQGFKFSVENVRKHIRNHYQVQEQAIRIRHYSGRIQAVINQKIGRSRVIEQCIAMVYLKILKYASNEPEDENMAYKNDIALVQLSKQMVEYMMLQKELDGELNLVKSTVERVQQIFVQIVNQQQDPKTKTEILKQLEAIRNIGD